MDRFEVGIIGLAIAVALICQFKTELKMKFQRWAFHHCYHGLDGTRAPCGPHCPWL